MTARENLLRTIRYAPADHIPNGLESVASFAHRDALFYHGNGDPHATRWTDAWGVTFVRTDEHAGMGAHPVAHPLTDWAQLPSLTWPDPHDPGLLAAVRPQVARVDRSQQLIQVINPGAMFVRGWLLRGMEAFLMDLLDERVRVETLLDRILEYQFAIAAQYLTLRPDIAQMGDDAGWTGALMMRPDDWRTLIKPRLRRLVETYHAGGCLFMFHCCGRVMDILDDIIEMGVDILNPLQAGANDLAVIKTKAAGRLALFGGIDAHTVATGTPQQVADLTRRARDILAPGGGWIASPDQGLPFPKENLAALQQGLAA